MNTHCQRCGRTLTDRYSIAVGYGPVCRCRIQSNPLEEPEGSGQFHDLPWDLETRTIRCEREGERTSLLGSILHFNIPRRIIHHSPTGWEWGYGGSGPADFALSILDVFLPVSPRGVRVRLWKGFCSRDAWDLHQDFKREFISVLPEEGGKIEGWLIQAWIDEHREGLNNESTDHQER